MLPDVVIFSKTQIKVSKCLLQQYWGNWSHVHKLFPLNVLCTQIVLQQWPNKNAFAKANEVL